MFDLLRFLLLRNKSREPTEPKPPNSEHVTMRMSATASMKIVENISACTGHEHIAADVTGTAELSLAE